MPPANFRIHNNQAPRILKLDGLSIRSDVLFMNDKGEEKAPIQKRSEKALHKLRPPLQRVLLPDEAVVSVMSARSPLTVLEQLTAAWWTGMLAASAIVVTNKRILFFPVKRDGSWRESVSAVQWGDVQEVKSKGLLNRNVTFQFRNGANTTYTNFRRADARRIAVIARALIPAALGEQTPTQGLVHLCPDCRNVLTPGQYSCSCCGLSFKNEKSMVMWSIFLPGGGYFYTGHPLIGIIPAVVEGLLALEVLLFLFAGVASRRANPDLLSGLLILALFWGIETAVTILHCRRYVREFIPEKRNPARATHGLTAKIGG